MHSLLGEVVALIHGEAAGATAEAVALGSELATVADFAEELAVVLRAVCRVEQFAAETCNRTRQAIVLLSFFLITSGIFFFFEHKDLIEIELSALNVSLRLD